MLEILFAIKPPTDFEQLMPTKMRNDLTADFVRSILDYDQETGTFVWKFRKEWPTSINTRCAGKKAGNNRNDGYLIININSKHYYGQRLAWIHVTGKWPDLEIDHKDLNPSNNKWNNLREATKTQNMCNVHIRSDNSSGFKGVSRCVNKRLKSEKWVARIWNSGKKVHLGHFDTREEAAYFYNYAAEYYHREFRRSA